MQYSCLLPDFSWMLLKLHLLFLLSRLLPAASSTSKLRHQTHSHSPSCCRLNFLVKHAKPLSAHNVSSMSPLPRHSISAPFFSSECLVIRTKPLPAQNVFYCITCSKPLSAQFSLLIFMVLHNKLLPAQNSLWSYVPSRSWLNPLVHTYQAAAGS